MSRVVGRVAAALIVGAASGVAGGLASGDWTGPIAMGAFATGCFIGALSGLKALEIFHAL